MASPEPPPKPSKKKAPRKVAHLIGNGPSKQFFKNVPEGDVYGCNFGVDGLEKELKGVFIHDRRPLRHLFTEKMKFGIPIILRDKYGPDSKKLVSMGLIPKGNISFLPNKIRTRNSGHDGILYLLQHSPEKYTELHLWGFDSLVSGSVESDSKEKIRGSNPKQRMVQRWIQHFASISHSMTKRGKTIFLHHNAEKVEKIDRRP